MKIRLLIILLLIGIALIFAVTFVTTSENKSEPQKIPDTGSESQKILQPKPSLTEPDVGPTQAAQMTEFSTLDDMVRSSLGEALGRDVSFKKSYKRENDDWLILCGKPMEMNGQPFNYEESPLKEMHQENLIEDKFCLLAKKSNSGFTLMENDIGSLDSPVLSWLSDYQLPPDLIK